MGVPPSVVGGDQERLAVLAIGLSVGAPGAFLGGVPVWDTVIWVVSESMLSPFLALALSDRKNEDALAFALRGNAMLNENRFYIKLV